MNNISFKYIFNYRTKNPMFKNTSKNSYFLKSSIIFTILFLIASIFNFVFAQQTYNLEIIMKTDCPSVLEETFGVSLSSAGDVNNDGFMDVVVGSKSVISSGRQDTSLGHAYIYLGSTSMDSIADIFLHGEHPLDLFAFSVVGLGDVNCDSFDDVAVSAPNCSQIDSCGRVYIYFGSSTMDSFPDLVLKGNFCTAFGCAIASGDVNGDQWNDIVVGEYWWNNGDGRVYVYYGGTLLDTIPDVIINGHNGECFGKSVGSGGDVNSDGFKDIVVGADENNEAYPDAGKVYVFCGGNPMDTIPDCWLHGEGVTHYLGWFPVNIVSNISDFDRILTGTPLYPYGFPSYAPGKLYVLFGGSPPDTLIDWYKHGEDDSSSLGMASSSGGFESADIFGEFIAGAPIGATRYGKGAVWLGGMPMDSIEDAYLEGDIFHHEIGWKVASASDVNGDGYDEVMFGNYAGVEPTVWVCKYTGPGITEHKAKSTGHRVEIYPNPFSGFMYIDPGTMQNIEHIELNIFDVSGREVMNYAMKDRIGGFIVNMEDLPDGIYFVQIKDGNDKIIKKAVKVH